MDAHVHGTFPESCPNDRAPPYEPYTVITNVRTPLQSLVQVIPDPGLSWITQVRLYFVSPAGGVFLDDVEFSP